MTRTDLSKREAIEKYSNQGLYLMTINIWYDGIKVSEDEDYLWGIFSKTDVVTQYAKQKIAARSASIDNKFENEVYEGTAISASFNRMDTITIPAISTWEIIDKGNFKNCIYKVSICQI